MIFEKNPFTTADSVPKSFHLNQFSPNFEIHQLTLISHPECHCHGTAFLKTWPLDCYCWVGRWYFVFSCLRLQSWETSHFSYTRLQTGECCLCFYSVPYMSTVWSIMIVIKVERPHTSVLRGYRLENVVSVCFTVFIQCHMRMLKLE